MNATGSVQRLCSVWILSFPVNNIVALQKYFLLIFTIIEVDFYGYVLKY